MENINGTKDVFTFEVLCSLMESIPREMAEVLKRTSYHPIFNEVMDFSTALMNGRGELAARSGQRGGTGHCHARAGVHLKRTLEKVGASAGTEANEAVLGVKCLANGDFATCLEESENRVVLS